MDLVFGLLADGGSYPEHAGDGDGASGSPVVGPLGLVELLETALGLGGPLRPQVVRIAAWHQKLAAANAGKRFWSASLAADPWATAQLVLGWRDALVEAGWTAAGSWTQARLADLAAAEEAGPLLPPGPADRLALIRSRLDMRAAKLVRRIRLVDSRADLPPGWRGLLDQLEALGVVVEAVPLEGRAEADTALGRAQRYILTGDFEAGGADGTILRVVADTPLLAAEAVAAWLPLSSDEDSVALVAQGGETQLLDNVLALHGQPRGGLAARSPFRGALQVLPLAFQIAWQPFDAHAVMDLLALPRPPIGRRAARRLSAVLAEAPGVGGPEWLAAWTAIEEQELAAAADERAREKAGERLSRWRSWVEPLNVGEDGLTMEQVLLVASRVAAWGRAMEASTQEAYYRQAVQLAEAVAEAAKRLERKTFSRTLVERIIDQALSDGACDPNVGAECAAWRALPHPGAVWSGVDVLAWWNFNDTGERPPRSPWSIAERSELAHAGCEPDTPAAAARRLAASWERAILNTRRQVVFVRSTFTVDGEDARHPLAHRLAPVLRGDAQIVRVEGCLETDGLEVGKHRLPRLPVEPTALPAVAARWALPAGFAARVKDRVESATAFEDLLACQMAWALKHVARLRPGRAQSIPDYNRLLGNLAHRLAKEIFQPGAPPTPADAIDRAEALLDTIVDQAAAPLRAPGAAAEFAFARRRLPEAMGALARTLADNGLTIEGAEVPVTGIFAGVLQVRGSIDLLARDNGGRPVVIDLKWTHSGRSRINELAAGNAVQLATYSAMVTPDASAEAGYFLLNQRQFLTLSSGTLQGRRIDGSRDIPGTWTAVLESWSRWRAHADSDGLLALGVAGAVDLTPDNVALVREVKCDWCDYSTVCRVKVAA
jgi:ATP-dependent helicase/nuclease subunit B